MVKEQTERRIFKRQKLDSKVFFEDENSDKLFFVKSRDISLGGIFLEGELPLKTGSLILVSFALPGHKREVHVTGEVVRHAGEGVGIRFAGLNDTAQKWIEEYIG